jgi:hypothetical protein
VDDVCTVCPRTGAEGEQCYFGTVSESQYLPGGKVKDVLPFKSKIQGDGPLQNGIILVNGAKTATGSGTIFNAGAITATQKLYAVLHVYGISGTGTPTITVTLQSAALVGFGSPTTRVSFTAVTAVGAQFAVPVPGPITDAFWRMIWTVSGTNPSLSIVGGMDIW